MSEKCKRIPGCEEKLEVTHEWVERALENLRVKALALLAVNDAIQLELKRRFVLAYSLSISSGDGRSLNKAREEFNEACTAACSFARAVIEEEPCMKKDSEVPRPSLN